MLPDELLKPFDELKAANAATDAATQDRLAKEQAEEDAKAAANAAAEATDAAVDAEAKSVTEFNDKLAAFESALTDYFAKN